MDNTTTTFAPTSFVYCGHVFVVFYSLVYISMYFLSFTLVGNETRISVGLASEERGCKSVTEFVIGCYLVSLKKRFLRRQLSTNQRCF